MADRNRETTTILDLKWDEQHLVPAIVQDAASGRVLMMGWMNEEAWRRTLRTSKVTFYSRSQGRIWVKGEQSGHTQEVVEARVDCDQDVVLLRCKSYGPCCHAGYESCFYRVVKGEGDLAFVDEPVFDPDAVYKNGA